MRRFFLAVLGAVFAVSLGAAAGAAGGGGANLAGNFGANMANSAQNLAHSGVMLAHNVGAKSANHAHNSGSNHAQNPAQNLAQIPAADTSTADEASFFVSIAPLKAIVARFAPRADIDVMARGDAHTYEPTPSQMRQISRSAAFFAIGVDYEEAWLPRFAALNSNLRVADVSAGIERPDGDPHIWLDPLRLKAVARNVATTLTALYPAQRGEFAATLRELEAEFDALHARVAATLAGAQGRAFVVFHPSWGYFAARYGLVQLGIEEEGKEVKPADVAAIERRARELGVRVVLGDGAHSPRALRNVARGLGVRVQSADQLASDIGAEIERVARMIAEK